uniref:Ras-related protein Rab-1 n=1 Tax=Noctiluca scintillans TaxID=2966 RepID=A0A7S1B0B5_NOCSC|mmetsp:Transcript_7677/g.20946  ORF Transcript_7677/g.20946 Transcript_7677/m.20946 type:complete len:208 (+) Transcript_7677:54-677(+)
MSSSKTLKREYDHLLKLVLIGDSGAGKSCLLTRFADDEFTDSYVTTIGVDFRFKTISVDNAVVKLQIWDTAGQERFRTITSAYYRGADGIVLVYDICDRESLDHVSDWLREVNMYVNESTCKILVGNKCDDAANRQVTTEEAAKKAEELGMTFIETSAKEATNVVAAFEKISAEIASKRNSQNRATRTPGQGLLTPKNPPRSTQCCS